MPAKIKKRGTARWMGSVMVNGVKKRKLFPDASQKSFREAVLWEEEIKRAYQEDQPTAMGSPTVDLWIQECLDDVAVRCEKETYYEKLRHFQWFCLEPEITPALEVEGITLGLCRKFLTKICRERTGEVANRVRKNLAAAWKWARTNIPGWPMGTNPFRIVPKFPTEESPRYVPPEEDFLKVLGHVTHQQDYVMLMTYLHTAGRKSEIFNMKFSDLDFKNRKLRLWTRKRKGARECDWLPMTNELRSLLLDWTEQRLAMTGVDPDHVFIILVEGPHVAKWYGRPFKNRYTLMKRLCKRAGVKPFGFHAIRHLSASMLFKAGYPVSMIQRILRHKHATTTDRYLRKLGVEDMREGVENTFGNVVPFKTKRPLKNRF